MKYCIYYPTPLEEIDPLCDNADVCLSLADGREYTLVVCTPNGLTEMMNREGQPFIDPNFRFAVVEAITDENIRRLVEVFLQEDEGLLQAYGGDVF